MTEAKKTTAEIVQELKTELAKSCQEWSNILYKLTIKINTELKQSLSLEAEAISYRQELTHEIANYSFNLTNDVAKLKKLKKTRFEYYATKYQIKTNGSEKNKLVDADVAFYQEKIDVLDNYLQFLIETKKSMDHVVWSVKNKIQLYNLTEMEG
jgi:hypothetical protein